VPSEQQTFFRRPGVVMVSDEEIFRAWKKVEQAKEDIDLYIRGSENEYDHHLHRLLIRAFRYSQDELFKILEKQWNELQV
jgi:hypothetical protein